MKPPTVTTKRLSEEEITERLRGRSLAIVKGTFKSTRESASWLCLADSSHGIFFAPPRQIIHAYGSCPKCGKVGKLSEKIVQQRLGDRRITLVAGTLEGSDKKATWLCLAEESHGTWEATPSGVLNSNSGCPVCSGKLPLTEIDITKRLADRSLELVDGSYKSATRVATWRCLKVSTHGCWTASVKSVLYQKTGCPICSGNTQLTEEVIRHRLSTRNIEIVEGTLRGARSHAQWKCLGSADHPIWYATPSSVLGGSNCPACTGHERITSSVIRRKLKDRSVMLISETVVSSKKFAEWGCTTDPTHRNWVATVSSVLGGSGCPECAGNAKLNGRLINERLSGRGIRIDESSFKSSAQHAMWICLAGRNHPIWSANVSSVLGGVGCPSCSEYGFKEHKPAYIYLLQIITGDQLAGIKCGITNNNPAKRMKQITRKSSASINLIRYWHHPSGALIRSIESSIRESFTHNDLGQALIDGRTETFHAADLDEIIITIEKNLTSA